MLSNLLSDNIPCNTGQSWPSLALYVHWPFCRSKCPYCDFNSYPVKNADQNLWLESCLEELRYYPGYTGKRILTSIYFGGGTPSLMPPETVSAIINEANRHWNFIEDIEITLEANPESASGQKLARFRNAGINRLSIGVQSLIDEDLEFLGRLHNSEQALKTIEAAADMFPLYSIDLIYARPGQRLSGWEKELARALSLAGGHISLYQLTIEPGTRFYKRSQRGDFFMPGEEKAAEFYELTQNIMEKAGLPAYEISNHAAPGEESRHNLTYWRYKDYIGIGPGAHGRLQIDKDKYAISAYSKTAAWLKSIKEENHGHEIFTKLTPRERAIECIIMGLRINDGLPFSRIEQESGRPWQEIISKEKLKSMRKEKFLNDKTETLQATNAGRQRLDSVVKYLLL
jgi:oxygen-independent coproporphyrinogen-3 oxidase